jgi:hypothetical protein
MGVYRPELPAEIAEILCLGVTNVPKKVKSGINFPIHVAFSREAVGEWRVPAQRLHPSFRRPLRSSLTNKLPDKAIF